MCWINFRIALSELQSSVLWYYSQQWIYNSILICCCWCCCHHFSYILYVCFCLCLWHGMTSGTISVPVMTRSRGSLKVHTHRERERKKKFTIEILLMSEYFASNCKWIRHINDLNGTKLKIATDLCWFLEYQLGALRECTELTQILTRCTQWKRDSILFFQLYPVVRAISIFTYSIAFWYICMSSI